MRGVWLLLSAAAFAGCAAAANDILTDADLVARATAVMSVKEAPPDRVLGMHKGVPVMVEVRCGDVCPQYTVRFIHYAIDPGAMCERLGGDTVGIVIPVSIAVMSKDFCIPHVLYKRRLYVDHPYQK
jgi:hypothetical protein